MSCDREPFCDDRAEALQQAQDRIFCLEDALRPFAQYADTMYHLKDGDKVAGLYVAWFRTAAKTMHEGEPPAAESGKPE